MSQAKKNIKIICTIQNFLFQQRRKVLFCYHNLVFDELVVDNIKLSFKKLEGLLEVLYSYVRKI